jgi:hypothetical protein
MTSATRSEQYHHMNAGAHRRPPPQIGAPALTWQRGFWMPQHEAGRWDETKPYESPWKQSVDNMLAHLFRSLRLAENVTDCTSPNYDPGTDSLYLFNHKVTGLSASEFQLEVLPSQEKSVRHVVITARARFCGLWLTMSARLHHENLVILFALDFSGELDEDPAEAPELKAMSDDFLALHDLIIRRYDEHRKSGADSTVGPSRFDRTFLNDRERSEQLSKKLIARFKSFINKLTADACDPPCNDSPCSLKGFGEKFSDFVGLIYALRVKDGAGLEYAFDPEDQGSLNMSAQVAGTDFAGEIGLSVLDAAWPVVTGTDRKSDVDRAHGDPEYVVATFNERRTLYVSSLGRLGSDAGGGEFAPLIYTLIVSYASPWRLGRFVDKLHTAGTLRLAAMRDLQQINLASNQIDRLSRRLASDENGAKLFSATNNVETQFAEIGSDMELGLAYRIGRSRYYVNSYNDTVAALRPERVQGYQFYVDFVRSRVFDAFHYIDRVGARYESLKSEIEFRANLLRRQEARQLLHATADQARAAASLLEAAELLSVIPLTYYSGFLLMELATPLARNYELSWLPAERLPYYGLGLLFSVTLALTSNMRRKRRSVERAEKDRKRIEMASEG